MSAPAQAPVRVGDMKAGLTSHKTDPTIIGMHAEDYTASGMTYGADKYARGNYYGDPPEGVDRVARFLGYIAAAQRHLRKVTQAITIAQGRAEDTRAACAVVDDEPGRNAAGEITFPASNLPHIAHALASLMILVEVGVADGLLPAFPGRPWTSDPEYAKVLARRGKKVGDPIPQKDDPDREQQRLEELRHRLNSNRSVVGVQTAQPYDKTRDPDHFCHFERCCR